MIYLNLLLNLLDGIKRVSHIKIMSMLMENKELITKSHHMPPIDEIDGISNDKTIADNMHWVIPKMLREKLIEKNGKLLKLTLKGNNRFKRTTKVEREKWKRELSSICCSWVAREDFVR